MHKVYRLDAAAVNRALFSISVIHGVASPCRGSPYRLRRWTLRATRPPLQVRFRTMAREEELMMTAEELRLKRRKRRRLVIGLLSLLLLLVLGFFGARPALNAIKAWQARRHADKAFALIAQEKWTDARKEAVAAYQLRATEPQALRAVARFLSRTRQAEALEFWQQLEKVAPLTREDRQDEAAIAIMAGETARAEIAVQALLESKGADPAGWLLAAQLSIQKGAPEDARKSLEKIFNDPNATEREQFQAALLQLATSQNADEVNAGWARIEKLSRGRSATALDSLVLLARRELSKVESRNSKVENGDQRSASGPASGSVEPTARREGPTPRWVVSGQQSATAEPITDNKEQITRELAQRLVSHPLAKAPQKLLALDVRAALAVRAGLAELKPDELVAQGIAQWKDADTDSLTALAVWLNGKGEYQKMLDTIPLEKALQARDLFLQRADALGALGRWTEIKQLLQAERFPLDPVVQTMYLARCNAQLGEKTSAENNWKRALEEAGGDPGKLITLGDYAEKNGISDVAESAFNAAAVEAPKLRVAQQGRLRIAQRSGDTKKIHAVLADMLRLWPNDAAVQNDESYTRLLLMQQSSQRSEVRDQRSAGGTTSVSSQKPSDGTEPVPPSNDKQTVEAAVSAAKSNATPARSAGDTPATTEENLKQIEALAEDLVQRNPASMPHRTLLALARLRQNRAADALAVYENIQVSANALTPSALAVHAAVLAANGKTDDARAEAKQIKRDNLLPEERQLIEKLATE